MPYKIRKVRNKPCYRVYDQKTKKTFSKCSTKSKAKSQINLLRAIKYNKTFRKKIKSTARRPKLKIKLD